MVLLLSMKGLRLNFDLRYIFISLPSRPENPKAISHDLLKVSSHVTRHAIHTFDKHLYSFDQR